jgi:hypothetical protein
MRVDQDAMRGRHYYLTGGPLILAKIFWWRFFGEKVRRGRKYQTGSPGPIGGPGWGLRPPYGATNSDGVVISVGLFQPFAVGVCESDSAAPLLSIPAAADRT